MAVALHITLSTARKNDTYEGLLRVDMLKGKNRFTPMRATARKMHGEKMLKVRKKSKLSAHKL